MKKFPESERKKFAVFKKLNSPHKIQDFLNSFPINFEKDGDTIRSPLFVLQHNKAHCMEGALLAAAILWHHGERPLLLDLKTTEQDMDHVVTLFKRNNYWGALSKTNHGVLRYRDPVYKDVRELAMSYFNEYFLDNGKKTLRSYSLPFDLSELDPQWLTSSENQWDVATTLDESPHFKILKKGAAQSLRKADRIEIEIGKVVEWKKR